MFFITDTLYVNREKNTFYFISILGCPGMGLLINVDVNAILLQQHC